jgi:TonB family protein
MDAANAAQPTFVVTAPPLVRRGMIRFLLILVLTHAFAAGALASAEDAAAVRAARAFAIVRPPPEYPYLARRDRLTGAGVAVMHVDKATGVVTDVVMAPSTGHAVLDNAAMRAFRQWRFKPGTVSMVRLPITFAMPMTIYPKRPYRFSGIVRATDVRAGTITVKGQTGTDTIVVNAQTRLRKNGQVITLRDIAVSDAVQGNATVRVPTFTAVAQNITVKAGRK